MRWIIDGYNFIRQVEFLQAEEHNGGLAAGRAALLKFLVGFEKRWVKGKGGITVVFDGPAIEPGPPHGLGRFPASSSAPAGIQTVFSRGTTADQVIEELIAGSGNPSEITVVSADGEVKRFARRHRCSTLDPGELLDKALAPEKPHQHKPALHPDRQNQIESELRRRWLEKHR